MEGAADCSRYPGLVLCGWRVMREVAVGRSFSNWSVCVFRKANGGIIPQQDLLAVVNYFLLQIVASGDN